MGLRLVVFVVFFGGGGLVWFVFYVYGSGVTTCGRCIVFGIWPCLAADLIVVRVQSRTVVRVQSRTGILSVAFFFSFRQDSSSAVSLKLV